ncbi:MAG: hypothetical protein FWD52_08035 [Candidatus Bathyarchaeota archaeon]|nr:hypothetical protein [Candidatus Termiticorpusculum sp.]
MTELCDLSKIPDFEIAKLVAKRDVLQYTIEVVDQLLNKIGETKGYADLTNPPHQPTNQTVTTPINTEPNFDHLPFKSYKTKQAATSEESCWIFANTKGAEPLLTAIQNNNGKAALGSFEYSLTGPEKQFITRKPLKQEPKTQ